MANVSIARRYARALLEVASETNKLDVVADQLETFNRATLHNAELSDLLLNPAFTRSQRTSVVQAVLAAAGPFEPALDNVIRLLADRDRLVYLPDINRLFRDMVDARLGRLRGRITSSVPLDKDVLERLQTALAKITQRHVVLESHVDPEILGGVSAEVGAVVYDGSIRTQLEELRRTLNR